MIRHLQGQLAKTNRASGNDTWTVTVPELDGFTFNRTTKRHYTAAVLVRGTPPELAQARRDYAMKRAQDRWDWMTRSEEQVRALFSSWSHLTPEMVEHCVAEEVEEGRAFWTEHQTKERWMESCLAFHLTSQERADQLGVLGWCGRPGLAEKLALTAAETAAEVFVVTFA